jgi:hypothetical protein
MQAFGFCFYDRTEDARYREVLLPPAFSGQVGDDSEFHGPATRNTGFCGGTTIPLPFCDALVVTPDALATVNVPDPNEEIKKIPLLVLSAIPVMNMVMPI